MKDFFFYKAKWARRTYRNTQIYNQLPARSFVQEFFGFKCVFIVYRSNTQQRKIVFITLYALIPGVYFSMPVLILAPGILRWDACTVFRLDVFRWIHVKMSHRKCIPSFHARIEGIVRLGSFLILYVH